MRTQKNFQLDAGLFFMKAGIIHKTMLSETLFELQALLNYARDCDVMIRSLSLNFYVFISVSICLTYLPIQAAPSQL